MTRLTRLSLLPLSALALVASSTFAAASPPAQTIELAICLDTSGSMNGLIDSARARIWDIISDLATAQPAPKLRVALVTFGNDGHSAENGWTNVDIDLSTDLDLVSSKLFALTTNGGTELVGRVVDKATKSLTWSTDPSTLKIMVVAGNESADQDQDVKYQDACKRAIGSGIAVNSIYCGAETDDLVAAWKEVARLADGRSACINQNSGVVAMETPFDAELVALNASLNATYLAYGESGQWSAANQVEQDYNAANMSSAVAAQRCAAKGSSNYANGHWDLVDACKSPDFKLETVDVKQLPEAMRNLKPEERKAFVAVRATERASIQAKIQELSVKRAQFVAAELAKASPSDTSFERALRDAIRAQAMARGLTFPAAPTATPVSAPATTPTTPTTVSQGLNGC
jgi:hypothetical protein